MTYLFAFITAMVISMAIIPLMARLAPKLGMIDKPGPRKVHTIPIPRVGGVGIVVGALVPLLLWEPMEPSIQAYMIGSLVLLIFGVWDDIRELSHYTKFVGQFIAVLVVVYYGDIYITQLPFVQLEGSVNIIGKPFTVFAIVGMVNALNTSDGLDGLAGGISIISLCFLGYLSYLAQGQVTIMIAMAALGGVFGFLRFNTHPASVFMGDGGSQFLGFTLGVLAVFLTQRENPALSPAIVLLLLGLPVIDLLAVIVQRISRGAKWYRAYKDHIHHRLINLGFHHYEAVVIIYTLQCLLVASAMFLMYESDWLIIGIYLAICLSLFGFLIMTERSGWYAHSSRGVSRMASVVKAIKSHRLVTEVPMIFVIAGVPLYFIFISLSIDTVPRDFGTSSVLLAVLLLLYLVFGKRKDSIVLQAVNYVTSAFIVYLGTRYLSPGNPAIELGVILFFCVLAFAVSWVVRYASNVKFKITPMDYLVVFVVIFAGILLNLSPEKTQIGAMTIEAVILFYACELITSHAKSIWNPQNIVTFTTLAVLGIKSIN
jgi:UDP-GlcNAc:undecaprenyl-phosphate GlcNAc-1-phosphate transferase